MEWKSPLLMYLLHANACDFFFNTQRNTRLFIAQRNVKQYFPFDKATYLMRIRFVFSHYPNMSGMYWRIGFACTHIRSNRKRKGKMNGRTVSSDTTSGRIYLDERTWRCEKYLNWVTQRHIRDEWYSKYI